MKITATQNRDVTVLEVAGELTWDSVARFAEVVDRALLNGQRDFIVNLAQVESIDSAGLEALTALQRKCEEQLGMARFCVPGPELQKIFEMTRLSKSLIISADLEEAMRSFA